MVIRKVIMKEFSMPKNKVEAILPKVINIGF